MALTIPVVCGPHSRCSIDKIAVCYLRRLFCEFYGGVLRGIGITPLLALTTGSIMYSVEQ